MKVSIITVCYNSGRTIEKTIKSVLLQTYADIEYIVIDGNSNDNTVNIIKKYENFITKWISEPDDGLYEAMNKGLKLATGDIVGILNSDDTFLDNQVVEKVANFHCENGIDASVGNVIQVNSDGAILRRYTSKNWRPSKLRMGLMPPHPSIFLKRDLFSMHGNYYLDFVSCADYELIVRFFLNSEIIWKYSEITTTSMLVGGISSSGVKSYIIISKEIKKALDLNNIKYLHLLVLLRVLWKVHELFLRKFK